MIGWVPGAGVSFFVDPDIGMDNIAVPTLPGTFIYVSGGRPVLRRKANGMTDVPSYRSRKQAERFLRVARADVPDAEIAPVPTN